MKFLIFILLLLAFGFGSFAVIAGLLWIVCWAFALTWSLKFVIGVWAILMLLSMVFGKSSRK